MRFALGWLLVMTLASCELFFDDPGPPPPCALEAPDIASIPARNPDTGLCEDIQPGCDPCGLCGDLAPPPDWATCTPNACDGLGESACAFAAGCRTIYNANSAVDVPPQYLACWPVAPASPVSEPACDGLDAYQCSRHDNCGAYYDLTSETDPNAPMVFAACKAEDPVCVSSNDCTPGLKCSVDDGDCFSPPECTGGGACPDVCTGVCVRL